MIENLLGNLGRRQIMKKVGGIRMGFIRCFVLVSLVLFFAGSFPAGPAQAAGTCPSGMTSYWMLEETSGTTFADSVGGHTASCGGVSMCPDFTTGRIGNALIFDGATNGLNVASDASFNWAVADSFSIEFWMKSSGGTCLGNQVVVGRDDTSTQLHWWVGCWDNTGVAAFRLNDKSGKGTLVFGSTDLADGRWHHVVAVRDGIAGENRLYVDGILEGSAKFTYTAGFDSSAPLNIGWLNLDPFYHFAGTIDELAIYSRTLADKEIRQHYTDGSVGLAWGYCPDCAKSVRIMPLGDSITLGWSPIIPSSSYMVGYRQKLNLDLKAAGYNVDFVGSLQAGALAIPAFDIDHEGHGGWQANGGTGGGIAPNVQGFLLANPADVVLLHIGTNDISSGTQDPADIGLILDNIDLYSLNTTVVLARIINRTDYPAKELATTQFNDAVENLAKARIANGDKIIIVDQEDALDYATDMADTLHPNPTGYEKMSDVWLNALSSFLPVCQTVAPNISSSPVTTAYVGWQYSYNVDATGNPAPLFSLTQAPQGMTINSDTGIIQWVPSAPGNYNVTVAADNGVGTDSTQSFSISVAAPPLCPANMSHYWKLDETTAGSYADFYGSNNATCTDCPVATAGIVNVAQDFDAISRTNARNDNTFDWKSGDSFSIELWMKTDSGSTCSGGQVFVGRNDGATPLQWWLGCSKNGGHAEFYLEDKGGNGALVVGTTDLTDGVWHQVAASRDAASGTINIYVDGKKEGTTTNLSYPAGFASFTAPVNIGWLNIEPYYHFVGSLDEVAIYNRALSDSEVSIRYTAAESHLGYCDLAGYTLDIAAQNGSVASSPDQAIYAPGAPVVLTATPAAGYAFASWNGDASGTANPLTVIMDGNKNITANFAVPVYSLNITSVNGSVAKNPDQTSYVPNATVVLTATPAAGYVFTGWSGDASGTTNPLTVNMDGDKNITANFAVANYYSVVTPTAGETVLAGSNYLVQWTAPSEAVSFNLLYSIDNGVTWTVIASHITAKTYSWSVPKFVRNKNTCLVKAKGFNSSGVQVGRALSAAPFTIQGVVKLTSPNGGGAALAPGSSCAITWQTSASVSGKVTKAVLSYTLNGGVSWNRIGAVTGNPGLYNWPVPNAVTTKTKCKIKVDLKNSAGTIIGSDVSDAYFAVNGVVTLMQPNGGGAALTPGSSYPIEWQTSASINGSVTKAVVSYTLNGGVSWNRIDAVTGNPNPGTYYWTVPNVAATKSKCLVKVTLKNLSGTVVGIATSDAYFAIQP